LHDRPWELTLLVVAAKYLLPAEYLYDVTFLIIIIITTTTIIIILKLLIIIQQFVWFYTLS